jgi:hypothetical protein
MLSGIFPEGMRKITVRLSCFLAKIRTNNFPNTALQLHCYTKLLVCEVSMCEAECTELHMRISVSVRTAVVRAGGHEMFTVSIL